jgi:hypothetical protein
MGEWYPGSRPLIPRHGLGCNETDPSEFPDSLPEILWPPRGKAGSFFP